MEGDETIMANKKLLKEWEEEKGIRIRKRKHKKNKFTEKEYKKLIKNGYITCKTEKGYNYLQKI